MDRGAWQATVYGVANNWIRLIQQRTAHVCTAVEAQSLNRWTTREVPRGLTEQITGTHLQQSCNRAQEICMSNKIPDNHYGVITHLEPDILECEVKWALGSITTNKVCGDDGIPVEIFQILKDDAVKVLYSICQQIWKNQQWPQDWKRSVFITIPKKGNAKECSNYHTIALISYASKVMLKILQVRFQ